MKIFAYQVSYIDNDGCTKYTNTPQGCNPEWSKSYDKQDLEDSGDPDNILYKGRIELKFYDPKIKPNQIQRVIVWESEPACSEEQKGELAMERRASIAEGRTY
jgi:hypothetical protein